MAGRVLSFLQQQKLSFLYLAIPPSPPALGVVVSMSWGKVLDECFAIPSPFPLPRCTPAPRPPLSADHIPRPRGLLLSLGNVDPEPRQDVWRGCPQRAETGQEEEKSPPCQV